MTEIAATERLRLRPLQADDLQAFVACRSHPDVARYQSWDPDPPATAELGTTLAPAWFKGERTTMRVYAMLEREWRADGRSFAERPAGIR